MILLPLGRRFGDYRIAKQSNELPQALGRLIDSSFYNGFTPGRELGPDVSQTSRVEHFDRQEHAAHEKRTTAHPSGE